jgi:hypothetical protein
MSANTSRIVLGLVCAALLSPVGSRAWAAEPVASKPASKQQIFPTPEAAAEAIINAAAQFNVSELKSILGPDGEDLVVTDDEVQSKNQAAAFAAQAREKREIVLDPKNPKKATLVIGDENWPSPIPIVQDGTGWRFDSKAGRREILYRRIGSNELDAIKVCRGYVEAQDEYASEKHDGSTVNQYARKVISTPGTQDGLAWRTPDGQWAGPVGEDIARFIAEGYNNKQEPFHGYYFKVLNGQGPAAPRGAMSYMVKGVMIGGFALVAAPANYRVSGVKTFIVSHSGIVYEKDLGPSTLDQFRLMEVYNPDKTWTPVVESN